MTPQLSIYSIVLSLLFTVGQPIWALSQDGGNQPYWEKVVDALASEDLDYAESVLATPPTPKALAAAAVS